MFGHMLYPDAASSSLESSADDEVLPLGGDNAVLALALL